MPMNFAVSLDEASCVPLYVQLADTLRDAIVSGRLKAGAAMPSLRALAYSAGVSRPTASACYDVLTGQGFIEKRRGSGTFVAQRNGPAAIYPESKNAHIIQNSTEQVCDDLRELANSLARERALFTPRDELVPAGQWQKVITRVNSASCSSPDIATLPLGLSSLRQALAGYLHASKGIACGRSSVIAFSCLNQAIDILLRAAASAGDSVVLEDPCPVWLRNLMSFHGLNVIRVPVDEEGIIVSELSSIESSPAMIFVTPSHQQFTGALMSLSRRHQLIDWSRKNNTLVVEEDSDSQYRYGGATLPPLASLAPNVVYVSSMYRVLGPLSRIAYAVLPADLCEDVTELRLLSSPDDLNEREQSILSEFISSGCIDLAIRRTQKSYASLQQSMTMALTSSFKSAVKLRKQSGSMHLVAKFVLPLHEHEIEALASSAGIKMIGLRHFYSDGAERNEFAIPFAQIDARELNEKMQRFAALAEQASLQRSYDFKPSVCANGGHSMSTSASLKSAQYLC